MRPFLFFIAALSAVSAVAQVQVDSKNRLVLGSTLPGISQLDSTIHKSGIGELYPNTPVVEIKLDSLAQLCVLGNHINGSGGRISFGDFNNVYVGEVKENPFNMSKDILELHGNGGILMSSGSGNIARYSQSSGLFHFYTDVTVDGIFLSSDSRLKSNVSPLTEKTELLSGIEPIRYNLTRGDATMKNSASGNDESSVAAPASSRERFGFIAQQVREYFPELVREDEDGYLSVDYVGFIPVLVEAVNTLSQKVEDQQAIIDSMTAQRRQKSAGEQGLEDLEPSLAQNRPNPFTASSVIECTLPQSVAEASIFIYDMQGKQLMKIPVNERGRTSVNVDGRRLGAGMFIYALIADGEEIASRRMIITQ